MLRLCADTGKADEFLELGHKARTVRSGECNTLRGTHSERGQTRLEDVALAIDPLRASPRETPRSDRSSLGICGRLPLDLECRTNPLAVCLGVEDRSNGLEAPPSTILGPEPGIPEMPSGRRGFHFAEFRCRKIFRREFELLLEHRQHFPQ